METERIDSEDYCRAWTSETDGQPLDWQG